MVVVGAHLDSAVGPGIEDNGSGSMALLDMAIEMAKYSRKVKLVNKVLFAWWGAEEMGLLGSQFFLNSMSETERSNVACNINLDMVAAPNYVIHVLNGTTSFSSSVINGCLRLQEAYTEYFDEREIPYELVNMHFQSDFAPFIMYNIPANNAETSQKTTKTEHQRDLFGGLAGCFPDTCYHQTCDTVENISEECLDFVAKASTYVAVKMALQHGLKEFLASPPQHTHTVHTHAATTAPHPVPPAEHPSSHLSDMIEFNRQLPKGHPLFTASLAK
eukprot:TRINITY_DN1668_c0_g1_i11.p1 TRINITY_DN1668_c0_g1~~TRINITY_DN1668_c0_g1_i11.p1  ORF type:complete len:274 (-),score=50.66 TRINITY_DN1668_c0_g1_i11:87-908(-)